MEGNDAKDDTEVILSFGETPIVKFRQTAKMIIKNITIEPLLAVHSFSYGLVCIIVPSLYFDKICRVTIISFIIYKCNYRKRNE